MIFSKSDRCENAAKYGSCRNQLCVQSADNDDGAATDTAGSVTGEGGGDDDDDDDDDDDSESGD
jgi:hypothetical protein